LKRYLDKSCQHGAVQSALPNLKNDILVNAEGLKSLNEEVLRSADALVKKDKYRIILDVNSTEYPAYGNQEGCVCSGYFGLVSASF
jgi:hypothetical protein